MITKSDYISFLRCGAKFAFDSNKAARANNIFTTYGNFVGALAQLGIYENTFDIIDEIDAYKLDDLITRLRKSFETEDRKVIVACEVGPNFDWASAVARTKELMKEYDVIFEAAFERDGCACLVDVLYRSKNGWRALECKAFLDKSALKKASRANSGSWLDDITFQYWVVSATIPDIRFDLICPNHLYERNNNELFFSSRLPLEKAPQRLRQFISNGKFKTQAAIRAHLKHIPTNLAAMQNGQAKKTSQTTMCKKCPHLLACRGADWGGLFWRGQKFVNRKLSDLDEPDFTTTRGGLGKIGKIQQRILTAHRNNELVSVDTGILPFNSSDKCIDFESLIHPIPQFANCHPWSQIPFMFAVGQPGDTEVHIAPNTTEDPRYFLIDRLCELECHGRLFHWGRYDRDIIKKLIEHADEKQQKELLQLTKKMIDLCEIVKDSTYHPHFDFSFSIKKVGPHYSGLSYADCESDALTAGIDWLDGNIEAITKYCLLDIEQMFAVADGILGNCTFGDDIPTILREMIAECCDESNKILRDIPHPEDLEMKTKSALIHDLFMGAMERRGCKKGPLSGKPDLFLTLETICYLVEIKASCKRDWQRHTTEGQSPLPPHLHVLLDIDPDVFRIANVYVLPDATWQPGSSRNGIYERLTPDSLARMVLVWGKSHYPKLATQAV